MVDACMLASTDSTFLQQATHLTGGIYMRPKQRSALLQYLLVGLLPVGDDACAVLWMLLASRQQADSRMNSHVILMQPSSSNSTCTEFCLQCAASDALDPEHCVQDVLLLQTIYCPDSSSRSHLQLPQPLGVDFRASCFCHRVGFATVNPAHAHLPFTEAWCSWP